MPEQISTLHISGFAANSNDRELENFCRFLPGFVAAKASVDRGPPKLWVRFETPGNAKNALTQINEQPHDLRDATGVLFGTMAKTNLNPENNPRKWGATCAAGSLDALLGLPADPVGGASPHEAKWTSNKWQADKWQADKWQAEAPPVKWQGVQASDDSQDTLVILKPMDQGYDANTLHDLLVLVDGYVALRMGGSNAFVKFESSAHATEALSTVAASQLKAQPAKSSLNPAQATHHKRTDDFGAPAGEAAPRSNAAPPAKRQKVEAVDDGQDTVVIMKPGDQGYDADRLHEFFLLVEGYVALKMGGPNAFVKFESSAHAKEALSTTAEANWNAELARTPLDPARATHHKQTDEDAGSPGGEAAPTSRFAPPATSKFAPSAKRPGAYLISTDDTQDTLAILRPTEQGLSADDLHEFFLQVEGYVALRMSGATAFVKFQSSSHAQDALGAATEGGLNAQVARTPLNATLATHWA